MKTCISPEIVADIKDRALKGQITAEEITKMIPEEQAILREALEEFVSDKLGVTVNEQEVKVINEKAGKIETAQEKLGDDFGNPLKTKENVEFFKAKKEMDDYMGGLAPANKLRIATGTIGRGMMLASVKSPVLNIGSNTEVGAIEAFIRRVAAGTFRGADNDLAIDFVKMSSRIYQESGYDISRMMHIRDSGASGERILGDAVHTQGPGAIRKIGRFFEDTVFKQMMGAPDVVFASAHFADSLNLNAMRIAKGDKAKGRELMLDAMRVEPKTPEGVILREQAILDAQVATWTDNTWASKVSEGIRKVLNDVSGDARAGDYLLPFVKTPANIVATGMDYAGVGIPKALFKLVKAVRSGDTKNPETIRKIARDAVRGGIGLVAALAIASGLDEEDFVGAYDPARAQIEALRGANYNAIRIGNKWVSVDWLGPLSVAVTAMMYAKKYGDTGLEKSVQFTKGVAASGLKIPGVTDLVDTVRGTLYKKNQDIGEMSGEAKDYILEEISSRMIPSIFSDIAKATDKYDRESKGSTAFIPNKVITKLPGVRQLLPVKKDVFGKEVVGESAVSDILFGARVKTDKETALIREISNVSIEAGKGIAFTDWNKSTSKTLAQFKAKVGEAKYNKAKAEYGKELEKQLTAVIKNPKYRKLTDEEKVKVLTSEDTDAINVILKRYNFKYKREKSTIPKGL